MSIVFGFEPYSIEVLLARGSKFSTAILADEPWPDDVQIELRFTDSDDPTGSRHRWPASVDADQATWDVAADDVDALIGSNARHARLLFIVDGSPILWGKGPARVE